MAWTLPTETPVNYKVYLFRRAGSDVSELEITAYFTNIENLTNYDYNKLFVFDRIAPQVEILGDQRVYNDKVYYYKAVLRDEDSGEYSTTISCNGTAHPNIKVNIVDGKDVVATAITKMFDSVYDVNGNKELFAKKTLLFLYK